MAKPDVTVSIAQPREIAALVESVYGLFQEDAGQYDPCMDLTWPAREGAASYGREVDDPAVLLLLARHGERVVGHLVGRIREPSALRRCRLAVLESMRVAPDARGQGVGSRLIEEFLAWARQRGAEQATVTAYHANEGARRCYARHGFIPHEVTMQAPLNGDSPALPDPRSGACEVGDSCGGSSNHERPQPGWPGMKRSSIAYDH